MFSLNMESIRDFVFEIIFLRTFPCQKFFKPHSMEVEYKNVYSLYLSLSERSNPFSSFCPEGFSEERTLYKFLFYYCYSWFFVSLFS